MVLFTGGRQPYWSHSISLMRQICYWIDRTCQKKLRSRWIMHIYLVKQCSFSKSVSDRQQPCKLICFVPLGEVKDFNEMPAPDNDDLPFDFFNWPEDSKWNKFFWLLSYPLECLFFLTIPNIRRTYSQDCSGLCLVMSMLWISCLTYLCSWSITVIGG